MHFGVCRVTHEWGVGWYCTLVWQTAASLVPFWAHYSFCCVWLIVWWVLFHSVIIWYKLEELVWSSRLCCLPGQTSLDRWDCAFILSSSEQYLEGSDVLGSLRLSWTFLSMSLCFSWVCPGPGCVCGAGAWLKLAVMSVSMEGKKTHKGCQTWKSVKKGEEGSGGRVVRGVWGGEEMWSSCALKVESWFHPSLPVLNCERWVLPSQVCQVRWKSVCLWLRAVSSREGSWPWSEFSRGLNPAGVGNTLGFTSTEVTSARASGIGGSWNECFMHMLQTLPCLPQVFQSVSTKLCFFRNSFMLLSSQPHRGLHFDRCVFKWLGSNLWHQIKAPAPVAANGSEWVLSSPLHLPGAGDSSENPDSRELLEVPVNQRGLTCAGWAAKEPQHSNKKSPAPTLIPGLQPLDTCPFWNVFIAVFWDDAWNGFGWVCSFVLLYP